MKVKRWCQVCFIYTLSFICMPTVAAADAWQQFGTLWKAGFAVTDATGKLTGGKNTHDTFIPASTTKLVTAWLALQHWGEAHRFRTDFYFDRSSSTLWIKAGGDPYLVSEELAIIAAKIALMNPGKIYRITVDTSVFEDDLVVPGATVTSNPYDAVPSALAANFNTLYLKKSAGVLLTAEPQTPLTPFAYRFAGDVSGSPLRLNTGRKSRDSALYFVELLFELLKQNGIKVGNKVAWGVFPDVSPDLVHYNSRTLGDVIQGMLKYSTNFIANQLILTLVADATGRPANFDQVHRYMQTNLKTRFAWKTHAFYEGAGLSVHNRLSPLQLIDLLVAFRPWKHLLDEVAPGVFAKTGTLTNVSTLAGYLGDDAKPRVFSIMINEPVAANYSRALATELAADKGIR